MNAFALLAHDHSATHEAFREIERELSWRVYKVLAPICGACGAWLDDTICEHIRLGGA